MSTAAAVSRRHAQPFYRSPLTRWAFVLSGTGVTVSLWPGFASLHSSPSLLLLHHVLPWWAMFGSFAVYVVMLLSGVPELVIGADVLGCLLYGGDLIAILFTLGGNPVNGLGLAAFALASVMHFLAARLAIFAYFRVGDETDES